MGLDVQRTMPQLQNYLSVKHLSLSQYVWWANGNCMPGSISQPESLGMSSFETGLAAIRRAEKGKEERRASAQATVSRTSTLDKGSDYGESWLAGEN